MSTFEDFSPLDRGLIFLRAMAAVTEKSGVPEVTSNLARRLGIDEAMGQSAFRYVRSKGWIDTFNIPYTGRVNGNGLDILHTHRDGIPVWPDVLLEHRVVTGNSVEVVVHGPDLARSTGRAKSFSGADGVTSWDVFVSHASEDKDDFVRPLARRLEQEGLKVWYDEHNLLLGDSLRRGIDAGVYKSRFGVVVLSHSFMRKEWAQRELDGFTAREIDEGTIVLPIWHGVEKADVIRFSPTLADRRAVSSTAGLERVVSDIMQVVRRVTASASHAAPASEQPPAPAKRPDPNPVKVSTFSTTGQLFRELKQAAKDHHQRRLGEIIGSKTPVPLLGGGGLLLHLVPACVLEDEPTPVFQAIAAHPERFHPMATGVDRRPSRNGFEGLLVGNNVEGLDKEQRGYVQINRSCLVEAAAGSLARGDEFIELPRVEASLVTFVTRVLRNLALSGIEVPVVACVSLFGVDGMRLLQHAIGTCQPVDVPGQRLDSDRYVFGEVVFRSVPETNAEAAGVLSPILHHLAGAAGLPGSSSFGTDGAFLLSDAELRAAMA